MCSEFPGGGASLTPSFARTWSYCSGVAPVSIMRQIAMQASLLGLPCRTLAPECPTGPSPHGRTDQAKRGPAVACTGSKCAATPGAVAHLETHDVHGLSGLVAHE